MARLQPRDCDDAAGVQEKGQDVNIGNGKSVFRKLYGVVLPLFRHNSSWFPLQKNGCCSCIVIDILYVLFYLSMSD